MEEEEASPIGGKKRKPYYLSSGQHDLLNLDVKNKKSQGIDSLGLAQTNRSNMQRNHSQDLHLLGDSKNKKHKDSRSIKQPAPVKEMEGVEGGGRSSDLISQLPDDVLSDIISRLGTKEGARTQILSHRWKPLWSISPLNLQVDCGLSSKERERIRITSKILSNHRGSGRRLYLHQICFRNLGDKSDCWFQSPALNNLQELDFCYGSANSDLEKPLPSSALRFSSTLRKISLGNCHFPTDGSNHHSLHFPKLKQLSLQCVTLSENGFQGLLSGCPELESLLVLDCDGLRIVRVTSPTIRSIGVRSSLPMEGEPQQELVVRDTPCLERLITFPHRGPTTIQVSGAHRLKVLGYLSANIGKIEIGRNIFKRMISWDSTASIRTLKVLVLICTDPNLGVVLQLLKCFPCLETLYIMFSVPRIATGNVWHQYNPRESIYCLRRHLKKIIIRGYKGKQSDIDFANFFIANARVLQKMTIGVPRNQSDKWMANQCMTLDMNYKASKNAQLQIMYYYLLTDMDCQKRTHDLSILDPFDAYID